MTANPMSKECVQFPSVPLTVCTRYRALFCLMKCRRADGNNSIPNQATVKVTSLLSHQCQAQAIIIMADLTGLVKDMAFEYLPLVIKYFNGLPLQNNLSHYMERNGQFRDCRPVFGVFASRCPRRVVLSTSAGLFHENM